jgi:protocatechuate 3,4-dioxygenase beta subunit
VTAADADLTAGHPGEPLGERINVSGRILDGDDRPIAGQLVEVWQANAAGRYLHGRDLHPAPLDPNFTGAGRTLTGPDGSYRFVTIRPGAYPWANHPNAWRPAHIHFSVFGRAFTERLITQMYFPGDPLFAADPIMSSVRDERARDRMVAAFDWDSTEEQWCLGYRFDIVIGGHLATPTEPLTPSQTVGPFFSIGLAWMDAEEVVPDGATLTGQVLDGDGAAVPDALLEVWDGEHFGRSLTDTDGRYRFVVNSGGHLDMSVFARGLLQRLMTRVYFPGAPTDALLDGLDAGQRATLGAIALGGGDFRFDIHLQGDQETVFVMW